MTPLTDEVLFARVREAIARGWIPVPDKRGYGGTGGAGKVLEKLLGVDGGNLDIPDAGKWEIKFHSSSLLTLFHLEAKPKGHMHDMVRLFGIPDAKGRISFRHTLKGRSDKGLYVVNESGRISIRNDANSDVALPYWTHDSLINAFVAKLRRVLVVKGKRKKPNIRFDSAWCYQEPKPLHFIESIESGVVAIDFDARTNNGSGLRNHGTKFRVATDDLRRLYHDEHRIV